MTGSVSALREGLERFDTVDLGSLVVLLVVLSVAFDGTLESIARILVLVLAVSAVVRGLERADVGDPVWGVLAGSVVAAPGVAALVGGSNGVGALCLAVGCWLALDSIYESRHGEPSETEPVDEDISEAEMYTLLGHSRWVVEALREASRPLTADELRARTGLTEAELEEVLEITWENGTVERVGNGYVVDESELGGVAFVRGIVYGAGRRLLRPLRLFRPSR